MAKTISSDMCHYEDYYFNGTKDVWEKVSTETSAEDVIFEDGTTLAEEIEYLKAYGADVKSRVASAVSRNITFTSSDATWDEIITNIRNMSKYLSISKVWNFTGKSQTYTVPVTGTYQIECVGAQGNNGANGTRVVGNVTLNGGSTIYIYVGGTNGTNGGGTEIKKSDNGTVIQFYHSCEDGLINENIPVGITSYANSYNGGGATDIRLNGTALSDRIIVAGGGSGGAQTNNTITTGSSTAKSNNVLGTGSNGSVTLGTIVQRYGTYGCRHGCVYLDVRLGGYVSGDSAVGAGGGGYYGGVAGYAGTSYTNDDFSNVTITTGAQSGNGYMRITLLQED